jgi:hypothetical protein
MVHRVQGLRQYDTKNEVLRHTRQEKIAFKDTAAAAGCVMLDVNQTLKVSQYGYPQAEA